MDLSLFAMIFTGVCALATLGGTVFTTLRTGKDARDRAADRSVAEMTAEKLEAERNEITERTTASVLKEVRLELKDAKAELAEAKKELRAAYGVVDTQRQTLAEKNRQIEEMMSETRRAMRRSAALEKWIQDHAQQSGCAGLPADDLDDRTFKRQDSGPK